MGSHIKAYRTYDKDRILSIIADPAIVKTISEDDGVLDVDPEASCYIACEVDGKLSACWIFDKVGAVKIDVHAHILPAYRPHSKDIGAAIFKEILTIAPWAFKFVAEIPFCYPNVKRYAMQFGFKEEGVDRQSYKLKGEILDCWYLGATQQELNDELG